MDPWGRNRITSKYKGPEAGVCLRPSRNHTDVSAAEAEEMRGAGVVRDAIREGEQMGMGILEDKSQRNLEVILKMVTLLNELGSHRGC